jgi:hypothetical protein
MLIEVKYVKLSIYAHLASLIGHPPKEIDEQSKKTYDN